MKRILVVFVLALTVSSLTLGQDAAKSLKSKKSGQQSKPSAGSRDEQEIRKLINDMSAARMRNDKAAYNRLVSEDYYSIRVNGQGTEIGNKDTQDLNTTPSGVPFISYEVDELRIKVYGNNSAVVTGRRKSPARNSDGTIRDVQLRFMSMLVKQHGHWQVVASSLTTIVTAQPR